MLCAVLCLALAAGVIADIPTFEGRYSDSLDDHHRFGKEMGMQFKDMIHARVEQMESLNHVLMPYVNTGDGEKIYKHFLQAHRTMYPKYMAELDGVAEGCGLPLATIFVMNLKQEFTYYAANASLPMEPLQCSDYMVNTPNETFVAHNEDSSTPDLHHTFLARVTFPTHSFVAYTYAGDLPSGAFGFSSKRFAFSLNLVQPAHPSLDGFGRGFISRDLLSADSFDDGLARITTTPMIGGHNYQLMDTAKGVIANVEVAPNRWHAVRYFYKATPGTPASAMFHANQYTGLVVDQVISNSSSHRMARAAQFPLPTIPTEALHVLGDQEDRSWPIFHDAKSRAAGDKTDDWTLATVLFNLRTLEITFFDGNPRDGRVLHKEPLW